MSFDLLPADRTRGRASFSNWQWRPLRFYIWMLAPRRVTHGWDFNDGEHVSDESAQEIAGLIDAEIASGRAVEFMQAYNRTCDAAQGWASAYPLDVGLLQRFAAFCRTSGGFTIE